ncbi:MAG: hypothetical protein JNK04_16595 [Myxococcales bacterium]|nr:hypothetical protein [Myxococcales bacterium]
MGYRNEEEGLRLRIAELERDLGEANERIARLEGRVVERAPTTPSKLFGLDLVVDRERIIPGTVSDAGIAAIATALDARLPRASSSQIAGTFTHRRGTYELRVAKLPNGSTSVRVTGDYRNARLMLLIGSPGLMLIAGVLLASVGSLAGPIGIAIGAVLGAAAAVAGLRGLMKRAVLTDQRALHGLFETAASLAAADVAKVERARVAVLESSEAERDAEEEVAAAGHAPVQSRRGVR